MATWLLAMLVACGGGSDAASAPDVGAAGTGAGRTQKLSLLPFNGGTIAFSTGMTCTGACDQDIVANQTITLTAQAATGFSFEGWDGGCTGGGGTCTLTVGASTSISASFVPTMPLAGLPFIQFTDSISGPIKGGEFGQGSYLSIFGTNFGSPSTLGTTTRVYIGNAEVANYRYLGPAKVGARLGLQQLVVQVGSLNNAITGVSLPIRVKVGGISSNVDNRFTPNPGRIFFVALNGNDKTAVVGDISHPFRYLQTETNSGVAAQVRAGDHIVIRGGHWIDTGLDDAWFRFRYPEQEGSAPNGKSGSGWIQFTAYPGPKNASQIEDVHYTTPAGKKGGIQGANSAYFETTGDYIGVSNLRLDVDARAQSDAAPINLQYSGGPWRVVNNEIGPWPSAINALAAGVSGHGAGSVVLGNHIHDIACKNCSENHGIYADSGASDWQIAFNWIHDITGGNLIQLFDSAGLAGQDYVGYPKGWLGFTGMNIFNNWLENSGKYGLNLADSTISASIWNNVVKGSKYAGLRVNSISKDIDIHVAFNTFYDNVQVFSGSGNAQVLNTWGKDQTSGVVHVDDNVFVAGPHTLRGSTWFETSGGLKPEFVFNRNLWWDNGLRFGAMKADPLAIMEDPKFTLPGGNDFTLMAGSPAVDAATFSVPMNVFQDLPGRAARPIGKARDLGAYERAN